ncbi:methyltransferase family protein [Chthonobacter rhizosphaerae]|uniref:methyltransferase family protein n=1 Tax=Chthonobacter rhizosphaerae TaxID=2735553 RepID=UPI0015EEF61B|nr:isoprenylcysteine carboxylmethyltransferase family protein [Chthonobacter rhizosphaerae]
MDTSPADRPNRLPWPPMILLGTLFAGVTLEALAPTSLPVPAAVGLALVAAALAVDVWAMVTMARAKTNILPHRAADRLVTSGPFHFSRNPIYVGNAALIAGCGIAVGSVWLLALAPVAAYATHRLAVLREERHLAARFGEAWAAYARSTPRWLGPRGRA